MSDLTETFQKLLDIKRESNTLEITRCTALLSAAKLEQEIKEVADEYTGERSIQEGITEVLRLTQLKREQMVVARGAERQMEELKWRLLELENDNAPYMTGYNPNPHLNPLK